MVPTAAPSWIQAGPEATPCPREETWLTQRPQPGTGPGAAAASQASPFLPPLPTPELAPPLPAGQAGRSRRFQEEQGSPVDTHERALNPVPISHTHILYPHPQPAPYRHPHLPRVTFLQLPQPVPVSLATKCSPRAQHLPAQPPQPGTQPRCLGSTDVRPRARLTEGICGGPAFTLHQPQPFAGRRAQGHGAPRSRGAGPQGARCGGVQPEAIGGSAPHF